MAISASAQYQGNLAELIKAMRLQYRKPGDAIATFAEMTNLINVKIMPVLGEALSTQSLQQWSPDDGKTRHKREIAAESARKLGVFLGSPARTAAEDFQLYLRERRGPFVGTVEEDYANYLKTRTTPTLAEPPGQYGRDAENLEDADTMSLLGRWWDLSAESQKIAKLLEQRLLNSPPTLRDLLWAKLREAKDAGKIQGSLAVNALAGEFSALCHKKISPVKIAKILTGEIVEIDLELSDLGRLALGLQKLFPEEVWAQNTVQDVLKHGFKRESGAPTPAPSPADAHAPGK